jgi:hypothetical protein
MNNKSKKIFELKEMAIAVVGLVVLVTLIVSRHLFHPFYANAKPLLYSPEKEIVIGILILVPFVTAIITRIWYSFKLKKIMKEG